MSGFGYFDPSSMPPTQLADIVTRKNADILEKMSPSARAERLDNLPEAESIRVREELARRAAHQTVAEHPEAFAIAASVSGDGLEYNAQGVAVYRENGLPVIRFDNDGDGRADITVTYENQSGRNRMVAIAQDGARAVLADSQVTRVLNVLAAHNSGRDVDWSQVESTAIRTLNALPQLPTDVYRA